MAAKDAMKSTDPSVHRITNFLGLVARIGNRVKPITKQAMAARLHTANIINRSQRLRANQPSSSSLLLGAGRGAPALSVVGSCTYPPPPKGFNDLIDDKRPLCWEVLTGRSGSRRLQPSELIESLKEEDAISLRST